MNDFLDAIEAALSHGVAGFIGGLVGLIAGGRWLSSLQSGEPSFPCAGGQQSPACTASAEGMFAAWAICIVAGVLIGLLLGAWILGAVRRSR